MRGILGILTGLILALSLGATATAHVMERPEVTVSTNVAGATQVAEGHSQNDGDQVPADSDNGYPHHHGGCHGDHVASPVKLVAGSIMTDTRLAPLSAGRSIRPLSTADAALRPPQA